MFTFKKTLPVVRHADGGLRVVLDDDVLDAFGVQDEGEDVSIVVTDKTAMIRRGGHEGR